LDCYDSRGARTFSLWLDFFVLCDQRAKVIFEHVSYAQNGRRPKRSKPLMFWWILAAIICAVPTPLIIAVVLFAGMIVLSLKIFEHLSYRRWRERLK
jgi:predicted CDP-diglyceride synthetase/phosphatidate cytidylyltransferase